MSDEIKKAIKELTKSLGDPKLPYGLFRDRVRRIEELKNLIK